MSVQRWVVEVTELGTVGRIIGQDEVDAFPAPSRMDAYQTDTYRCWQAGIGEHGGCYPRWTWTGEAVSWDEAAMMAMEEHGRMMREL